MSIRRRRMEHSLLSPLGAFRAAWILQRLDNGYLGLPANANLVQTYAEAIDYLSDPYVWQGVWDAQEQYEANNKIVTYGGTAWRTSYVAPPAGEAPGLGSWTPLLLGMSFEGEYDSDTLQGHIYVSGDPLRAYIANQNGGDASPVEPFTTLLDPEALPDDAPGAATTDDDLAAYFDGEIDPLGLTFRGVDPSGVFVLGDFFRSSNNGSLYIVTEPLTGTPNPDTSGVDLLCQGIKLRGEYDAGQDYYVGSVVIASDDNYYYAIEDNFATSPQDPTEEPSVWTLFTET